MDMMAGRSSGQVSQEFRSKVVSSGRTRDGSLAQPSARSPLSYAYPTNIIIIAYGFEWIPQLLSSLCFGHSQHVTGGSGPLHSTEKSEFESTPTTVLLRPFVRGV